MSNNSDPAPDPYPEDPRISKIATKFLSGEQRRSIVDWYQICVSTRYIQAQWKKIYGKRDAPSYLTIKTTINNYVEFGAESLTDGFRRPSEHQKQLAAKRLEKEQEKLAKAEELKESVRKALEDDPSVGSYQLAKLLKSTPKNIQKIAEQDLGLTIDTTKPKRIWKPKPKPKAKAKPKKKIAIKKPKPKLKTKPKKVLKRTPNSKSKISKTPEPPKRKVQRKRAKLIADPDSEIQPQTPPPPVTVEDDPELPNKIRSMLEENSSLSSHYLAVLFKTSSEIVEEIVEKDLGMTIDKTKPPEQVIRKRKRISKLESRRKELRDKAADRVRAKARSVGKTKGKIKFQMMTPAQRRSQQAKAKTAGNSEEGQTKPKKSKKSKSKPEPEPEPEVPPIPKAPNTIIQDVVPIDWLQESLRKLFPPKESQPDPVSNPQPQPVDVPKSNVTRKSKFGPTPQPISDPVVDPNGFVDVYKRRYWPCSALSKKKSRNKDQLLNGQTKPKKKRSFAKLEYMRELLKKNSTMGVSVGTRAPMAEVEVEEEYYAPQKKRRIAHVPKHPAKPQAQAKKQRKNKSQPQNQNQNLINSEFNIDNLEELDLEGCEVYELVEQEDGEPIFVLQQDGVQIQSTSQQNKSNASDEEELPDL